MLNIKDPKAHVLAQVLANETGESMTLAVIKALDERLDRVRRYRSVASVEELMEIGRRCAEGLAGPPISPSDLLYDAQGLPGDHRRPTLRPSPTPRAADISAANYVETAVVIEPQNPRAGSRQFDTFMRRITVEPVTEEHALLGTAGLCGFRQGEASRRT